MVTLIMLIFAAFLVLIGVMADIAIVMGLLALPVALIIKSLRKK